MIVLFRLQPVTLVSLGASMLMLECACDARMQYEQLTSFRVGRCNEQ